MPAVSGEGAPWNGLQAQAPEFVPRGTKAAAADKVFADMEDKIRKAQLQAGMKRLEVGEDANSGVMGADGLYGNWTDSYGNTVCVYSTDAFDANLIATLSRPPRHDINLHIKKTEFGCGWHCGDGALVSHSATQLWWVFQDGNFSVWTKVGH
mmetsp:Transcript_66765/g.175036  ORF Transcript_66765/g.175036 Transcript_66765/m.175036 type:complete len:152 (+) Transcript_66765:67-522(+)